MKISTLISLPGLAKARAVIEEVVRNEETAFRKTLSKGLREFQKAEEKTPIRVVCRRESGCRSTELARCRSSGYENVNVYPHDVRRYTLWFGVMTGVIVAAVIVMIIIVVDVDVDVVVVGPGFVAVMVVQHAINNPALLAIRAGMGGVCAGVGDVADCQGRAHGACPWLCGGDCCGCRGCKR